MAFGQARAGFIGDQGTVTKGGSRQTEGAIEQNLPGGGFEKIFAADDFRDPHCRVIHDHGELVRRGIVVPPDDEIAEVFAGDELLRAAMTVHERDSFAVGNAEAIVGRSCRVNVASCKLSSGRA